MRRELLSIVEGDGVHEVADRLEATHGCPLPSRHKKELRNTLASAIPPEANFFSAFREWRPQDGVCFAGRAFAPSPPPL
jgi:hypothetical protein